MTTLKLPKGTTGFFNERNEWVCTGSQMGRRNVEPNNPETCFDKLHLVRLPFVDGDYDNWGTYWGSPANVWCAFSDDQNHTDYAIRYFVRADSREEAKELIREQLPNVTFYR